MSTPTAPDPDDTTLAAATDQPTAAHEHGAAAHPDPITGEPGAHPVGVGVGALSAGAAGAAIGAIGGPIGMLIGAAIGAVAGGLAGKEVAASGDEPAATGAEAPAAEAGTNSYADEAPLMSADAPTPITMGSVPGEGFRAVGGSGFAEDGSLLSMGTSSLPVTPNTDVEDDALPMTTDSATEPVAGMQPPPVPESAPFMGETMPASGEEAVRVAAYYHYLDRVRAGQSGSEVGDWLEAEHEMMLN